MVDTTRTVPSPAGSSCSPSRRAVLERFGMGFGALALADLLRPPSARADDDGIDGDGLLGAPHFTPRARRVIWLFQSGAPSQIDLFDHKPLLIERHGTELPAAIRRGQRLTSMSGNQASLPLVGTPFSFTRRGASGAWMSDLVPHTARVADELCFVRSMHTDAINHGPGVTFLQTGSQLPGRPSIGAWLDYGLGAENADLPSYVVLVTKDKGGQPLAARLWGSGFLASKHQGERFLSGKDPVLYLGNPAGIDGASRRRMLDGLAALHRIGLDERADPILEARIAQYELAFRMQSSVPEATDFGDEPAHILDAYGPDARKPGSYAANCILARRLAERGVRFIQLFHPGWDQHGGLRGGIATQCRETDQPTAALIADLRRRGLLDDTIVVWGGEFGRTNYCQGKLAKDDFGRDHHPRCFTIWMAGGGVRAGTNYGETDEFGYNVVRDPVDVHDLHATILHLLGIDHERLVFKHQGRWYRLTDVHGKIVDGIIA